jgi:hypothetical protein
MISSPHFSLSDQPEQFDWHDQSEEAIFCDPLLGQHEVEQSIWRELQSAPGVHFSSLTVRRVRDGVCLQGVMEADEDSSCDVCDIVKRVAHVENVLNQLLVRESGAPRLPR